MLTVGAPQSPTLPLAPSPARVERAGVIVVGGGQAGLAAGQQLAERGLDVLILEAAETVGESWRRRWDSLRLFTPAARSGLPGMPFPAPSGHLPDKDEMADYLVRYAERFHLPLRLGTPVSCLEWNGDRFSLHANGARFEADQVVVATGPFQRPRVPEFASQLSADIHQLHSSEYRSPFDLPEGPVLVVGAANSGAQIAQELARFRKVWLAGRDTGMLPRRLLGRDLFDWVWPLMTVATRETRLGRRLLQRVLAGGDARIGISERRLTLSGITRVGRLSGVRGGLPIADGASLQPRVVVWCTGYASDYGWMRLPVLDELGAPRHRRGVAVDVPGLYFVGLRFQYRLNSSLIGGVGADARYVAEQVALRQATVADARPRAATGR